MQVNKIQSFAFSGINSMDEEEKRIARRLLQYGITPTGNKTADKARLHEIEIKEAKTLNYISNKFLTVTKTEQQNIQEAKKEKRKEINPELCSDTDNANKVLGEQIYLAIKMKKDK